MKEDMRVKEKKYNELSREKGQGKSKENFQNLERNFL